MEILSGICLIFIAISKYVFSWRMSMQIYQKFYLVALPQILYSPLDSLNFRKSLQICRVKISVQILTDNTGPMVSEVHAIWVDHRHDKKIIAFPQLFCLQNLVNKWLQRPVWICLSGMSTSHHKNGLASPLSRFFCCSYLNIGNIEAG